MTKDIKDYLHYYLGQPCTIADRKDIDYIRMVNETGLSVCTGTNYLNVPIWYKSKYCKPHLRPLASMTDNEVNKICSTMLSKETTCGSIWRSEEKDFIIAVFKQDKPLPPTRYKSMSMGIYIKGNCQVDYKWLYYTEENCEGSCGVTTEPLHNHHLITHYLLQQGFDLFGLIESGLAIEKSKTN